MTTKRICLWSSPRNLSTALMYSFAQRPDTVAIDEPFYAHYLQTTGIDHPGSEEILMSQQTDQSELIDYILHHNYEKAVVFFKQMTHHLTNMPRDFLSQSLNIIYIRNPKQIIASYAQVRPHVTQPDIGIKMQWELYNYLNENKQHFAVLDSAEILKNPEKVLRDLCSVLNIPFYKEMLSWPAGPKPEDGVWAKHWYQNVHQSTHFAPQQTSDRELSSHLLSLYAESKQYYDLLYQHSIKA